VLVAWKTGGETCDSVGNMAENSVCPINFMQHGCNVYRFSGAGAGKTKRICSGDNPNLTRKAFAESSVRYIRVTSQPLSRSSNRWHMDRPAVKTQSSFAHV
jgi:hypothetical protein